MASKKSIPASMIGARKHQTVVIPIAADPFTVDQEEQFVESAATTCVDNGKEKKCPCRPSISKFFYRISIELVDCHGRPVCGADVESKICACVDRQVTIKLPAAPECEDHDGQLVPDVRPPIDVSYR